APALGRRCAPTEVTHPRVPRARTSRADLGSCDTRPLAPRRIAAPMPTSRFRYMLVPWSQAWQDQERAEPRQFRLTAHLVFVRVQTQQTALRGAPNCGLRGPAPPPRRPAPGAAAALGRAQRVKPAPAFLEGAQRLRPTTRRRSENGDAGAL